MAAFRHFLTALAFIAASQLATGQEQAPQQSTPPPTTGGGGAPGGGTTGSVPGGTTSIPGRTTTPTQPRDTMDRFPEMQRPVFLSGKVMMEDGTPPQDQVVIERICNGIVRPEGYTDSKGRFSFQLGQNNAMMADASTSSAADSGFGNPGMGGRSSGGFDSMPGQGRGISERDLMGCEIRAQLAGHRSEVVSLAGRRFMDNPDLGTIIMRRIAGVEGLTVSATSAMAPKDARKAFEKGRDNIKKRKWADAQKELEKAVGLYPKYANAWFELGIAREQQGKNEEARTAYAEALKQDAKLVEPYVYLAFMDARENKWQDVADTTDRAIRLNPFDYPRAYFLNAVANLNMNKLEDAEKSAREAVKLDSRHQLPKANHVLGVILAQKQDYTEAAVQMRTYLQFAPNASDADNVKKQLAEMDKLIEAKRQP